MEAFAATSLSRTVRYRALVWPQAAPAYADFVETVQMAVSYTCNDLSSNPQLVQDHSEDQLTLRVVSGLKHLGLEASFETVTGGHCDVTVCFGDYYWLAEAKIHTDTGWLWSGYQQLVTRYNTGDPNSRFGGMLIYCFKPRTDRLMTSWQERMHKEDPDIAFHPSGEYVAAAFRSLAPSVRTGIELDILHTPVSLLFEPQDKPSKRTTSIKKRASKNAKARSHRAGG